MAALIPINAPRESINAPPKFPGLMEASVCIKFSYLLIPTWSLLSAEIIPCVTVSPTPKGFPMARRHLQV